MRRTGTILLTLAVAAPLARADQQTDAAREAPVSLPPFFVQEAMGGRPWQYLSIPGFEFLSRCSDSATKGFAQTFYEQKFLLGALVSPDLQFRTDVASQVILINTEMEKAISKEMLALMRGTTDPNAEALRIPQIRLEDSDSTGADFILNDSNAYGYRDIGLTTNFVAYLLARRTPPLPYWFIQAVIDLYAGTKQNGNIRMTMNQDDDSGMDREELRIPPAFWISEESTKALRSHPDTPRTFEPLAAALHPNRTAAAADDASRQQLQLELSEADLFVRWALAGKGHPRRQALWKFAGLAGPRPVTEAMIQECFGMGSADILQQLNVYLPTAVSKDLELEMPQGFKAPQAKPRKATETEIARIQGDWETKEIQFVRAQYPEYAPKYVSQAERTFSIVSGEEASDPAFQAILGIFEYDQGNLEKARPLLENAVKSGVDRPRAYMELGWLRLHDAIAKPAGPGGSLSGSQCRDIFEPLQSARRMQPPQFGTYAIIAGACEHAADPPTDEELAILGEGLRYFPASSELAASITRLKVRATIAAGKK